MSEKEQTSISLKYIDTELYDEIEKIAISKGLNNRNKKAVMQYVLEDYVHMHQMDSFRNPYLIKNIQAIIDASNQQTEKNIGGRLTKITVENAINIGILNRIVLDFMNKFSDDEETAKLLNSYRQQAVEDLQQSNKPISYYSLLHEDE